MADADARSVLGVAAAASVDIRSGSARRSTDKVRNGVSELHADGMRALYEQAPASLAGNAIGISLIALAFWPLA